MKILSSRFVSRVAFVLGSAALMSVVGCGIPEEVHNQAVRDLDKCKQDLSSARTDLGKSANELSSERNRLSSLEGEKGALAQDLTASQKELAELRKAREASEKRNAEFKAMIQKLRSMIDAGKLHVEIRKGKMVVQLPDKVLYDTGKANLNAEGQTTLSNVATVLKEFPDRDFLIAGHTDNKPIRGGKFKSNWDLSTARAVTVVQWLQQQGVDPRHLAAAGYSEFDPVGDNSTEQGAAQNRRLEIVVMPNVSELPQLDSSATGVQQKP